MSDTRLISLCGYAQQNLRFARFASAGMVAAGALLAVMPAQAQTTRTPAGTIISNTATATYDMPGGGQDSITSNTVNLTVDELLDVSVVSSDPGDVIVFPGATNQVLAFLVTNAGNGSEAFVLTAQDSLGGDDFDPSATSIVIDGNGNGTYDPGIDIVYVPGANEPVLTPDASVTVFVLSSIPAGATDGQRGRVDLVATAATGSGTPGTSFAGQGQGGGNAVIGATGASAQDDGYYALSVASVTFVKSATLADPFGGATQVPGAIITYQLVATVTGSGNLANLGIADAIPDGTTYQAGSIRLEGSPLTDAADADAGEYTGSGIAVRLGDVAAGSSRTVTFQVAID